MNQIWVVIVSGSQATVVQWNFESRSNLGVVLVQLFPPKSLSHSTQSISEYLGGKSDTVTRSRRWSIDNTEANEEDPHKLSPLSL